MTSPSQQIQTANKVRPNWDEIWMKIAFIFKERSIDPRMQVGCVIVSGDDNAQILSIGYNGQEKGGPNEVDSLEPGQSGCLHAEENAIIKLDYNNHKRKVMYVTTSPCTMCSKRIVNASIDEVVYATAYRDPAGLERLKARGVKVRQYDIKN